MGIALDAFAHIEDRAETVGGVEGVAKGDEGVIAEPGEPGDREGDGDYCGQAHHEEEAGIGHDRRLYRRTPRLRGVLRVGLTGGIGSGKSTVARLLAERGAIVIDADGIAREIVEPGEPALAEIAQRFGVDILAADGSLDRAALAGIVFTDEVALADLNAITHPRIAERTAQRIAAAPQDAVVVYDMPLLVENDLTDQWDVVLVVEADRQVRIARLKGRGLAEEDIQARMDRQATDEQRRAVADIVLDNSGTVDALTQQVATAWVELDKKLRGHTLE